MTQRLFAISLALSSSIATIPFFSLSALARPVDFCDTQVACASGRQFEKCGIDGECHRKENNDRNNGFKKLFGL